MGEDRKPRLISGEIMTEHPGEEPRPPADVVDADVEVIPHATAIATAMPQAAAAPQPFLKPGNRAESAAKRAGPLLFWGTALLAAFLAFWVAGGHEFLLRPLAARIGAAPSVPLRIEGLESRVEMRDGSPVLLIDGQAVNRGVAAFALPGIVIAVKEKEGPTVRYFLGTNDRILAPGESFGFSSRLGAPANGVATVSVTFQEDRN